MHTKTNPKVSIGLPVYNGEKFIHQRLDGILSQTLTDFELIIYDNSIDSTPAICKEYTKKDKRIRYFYDKKKLGWERSWMFCVDKAIGENFVWATVDDKWSSDFLEKNVQILDSNKNIVGSTGKVKRYGPPVEEFKSEPADSIVTKVYKKIRRKFRPFENIPAFGIYEKRAQICLRNISYGIILSIVRTDALKKSLIRQPFFVWDWAVALNLLRYGNFHVFDEVMYYYNTSGLSSKGIFNQWKIQDTKINEYFLPYSTFTHWCINNIGIKFFLKNLDYFIWLNFTGVLGIIKDIILILKNK